MSMLLHIADRVLNRPLLIHPDKVPLILGVLEGRLPIGSLEDAAGGPFDPEMTAEGRRVLHGPVANSFSGSPSYDPQYGGRRPYQVIGGVAVIQIIGSLVNRGAWLGAYSGLVSYEALQHQLRSAAADDRIRSILLDIESPGGEATGAFETAALVREVNKRKPVTAFVNGMAASAAYAIASGARKIVTIETGISGSIGVITVHTDQSRRLDQLGISPTILFAGKHKADGHPFGPLPDGVRSDIQAEINRLYALFIKTVAAGRSKLSPDAIRGTEARVYIGAEAVRVGLADAVGTFESVLAELSPPRPAPQPKTYKLLAGRPFPKSIADVPEPSSSTGWAGFQEAVAERDEIIRLINERDAAEAKTRPSR